MGSKVTPTLAICVFTATLTAFQFGFHSVSILATKVHASQNQGHAVFDRCVVVGPQGDLINRTGSIPRSFGTSICAFEHGIAMARINTSSVCCKKECLFWVAVI
jgi:hypothetical protein